MEHLKFINNGNYLFHYLFQISTILFQVSFTPEEKEKGEVYYNYGTHPYLEPEGPGISIFYKDENGHIFHTYSSYARG